MTKKLTKILLSFCFITLSSCTITGGEMRRSVGLNKDAPDEFMVLPKRKLSIPEGIYLPKPGEQTSASQREASIEAKEEIFGIKAQNTKNKQASELENLLSARLARFKAEEGIRKKVNEEAEETYKGGITKAIIDPFSYNRGDSQIIEAQKENKRIQESLKKGKKVTGEGAKVTDKYNKLR